MFRLFNKSRQTLYKWILAAFLGIMALGMVGVVTPFFSGNGDSTQLQANVLASLDGNDITTTDLRRELQNQFRNSPLGNDPQMTARLAPRVFDDMVLRLALSDQAQKLGLEVSNQELEQTLQQFFEKAGFPSQEAYESQIQQETGMSVAQFEAQYRDQLLRTKVQDVVTDDVRVTPEEVRQEFEKRFAKAKIDYVSFDSSQYLKDVQVKPDALLAFFGRDPSHYKVPEQRQVRYVLITPDRVRAEVNVSDQDLRAYYVQHLSDYRVPERVKLARILFKTAAKSPAEVSSIDKQAEDVLKQIRAGGDFAELARKNSQDTTAQNGGEVGWIVRGQTEKAFEDTAFSLKPGQVSNLVKTLYGIDIIKLEDHQPAHLQTFDEVKGTLRAELEKQKVEAARDALASRMQQALKTNPHQFDPVAKSFGLDAKETPLFKFNQAVPDLGNNESFENLAFDLRQDEVGIPISVPQGTAIIQTVQIVPEHTPKLDEVHALVEQDYRADESKKLAVAKAGEFAAQAKSGDFNRVAKSMGLKVEESKDFTRTDSVSDAISGVSLGAAFTLNPGQTSDVISIGNTNVVLKVISHTPADEATFVAQKDQIANELLQEKRDLAFEIYRQNLKTEMERSGKLKFNASSMKEFLASYERR
jgi:peptidyl-prolyl cis-trans isomerase D